MSRALSEEGTWDVGFALVQALTVQTLAAARCGYRTCMDAISICARDVTVSLFSVLVRRHQNLIVVHVSKATWRNGSAFGFDRPTVNQRLQVRVLRWSFCFARLSFSTSCQAIVSRPKLT